MHSIEYGHTLNALPIDGSIPASALARHVHQLGQDENEDSSPFTLAPAQLQQISRHMPFLKRIEFHPQAGNEWSDVSLPSTLVDLLLHGEHVPVDEFNDEQKDGLTPLSTLLPTLEQFVCLMLMLHL